MAIHKSALGKDVDMGRLFAQNETMRAVTNNGVRMNARGDIIDEHGTIVESVNDRVAKHYDDSVNQRPQNLRPRELTARQRDNSANQRPPAIVADEMPVSYESQITEHEKQLEEELANEIEVELIKAKSKGKK